MRPTKTNPAYAYLAYQLAITEHTIAWLLDNHYGTDAQEAPDRISCEYLPREDSDVPADEVLHFVEELKDRKTQLEGEMRQFTFVKREHDDPARPGYKHLRTLRPARSSSEQQSAKPQAKKSGRRRKKES